MSTRTLMNSGKPPYRKVCDPVLALLYSKTFGGNPAVWMRRLKSPYTTNDSLRFRNVVAFPVYG